MWRASTPEDENVPHVGQFTSPYAPPEANPSAKTSPAEALPMLLAGALILVGGVMVARALRLF